MKQMLRRDRVCPCLAVAQTASTAAMALPRPTSSVTRWSLALPGRTSAGPEGGACCRPGSGRTLSHRPGWTLVQCLVVITLGVILVGIGGRVIGTVLRTQVALQEHLRLVRLRSHVARLFREDVRAAASAELMPGKPQLVLKGPAAVTWSSAGDRLLRQQVIGTETSTEAFLVEPLSVRFEVLPAGEAAKRVRLTLVGKEGTASGEFAILGSLGRDRRFAVEAAP